MQTFCNLFCVKYLGIKKRNETRTVCGSAGFLEKKTLYHTKKGKENICIQRAVGAFGGLDGLEGLQCLNGTYGVEALHIFVQTPAMPPQCNHPMQPPRSLRQRLANTARTGFSFP